jgi:glycerol-3-phosphate dehydrogenase subunit C
VGDMQRAGTLVYFHGCFANYYEPEMGKSLVEVMERNGFDVIAPEQKCCGMPMMANSNRPGAKKNFDFNVKSLARAAAPGYDIITTCPSCNEMLRREGTHLFDSEEARFVSSRMYDASEYLVRLHREGRLNTNFGEIKLKVFYHNPCHLKVQGLTEESLTLLKLIPGIDVVGTNMNCCGMGGSYGMKKINFDRSSSIAGKVWVEAKASGAQVAVTECGGCGLQIQAGTGLRIIHPIVLLNQAYKSSEALNAA